MHCHVVLIGEGDLAEEVKQALEAAEAEVYRLKAPGEREVRQALEVDGIDRIVIVSRDDAAALRMALMVRNLDDELPLLVTIFDPTMARQVEESIEHCEVTSMADIVAPSLAGPCLGDDLAAVREDPPRGIRETDDGIEEVPLEVPSQRRTAALARAILTPYDKSAALLLWGALGLVVILLVETAACMAVLGQGPIDAAYGAAKTLVTVDPNDEVNHGPSGLKAFLTVSMLAALVFEAGFTAGLVNRLIDRRLTGLFGRRAVPRRDHVVVVGMGQVGLRLALLLRRCGIGVVAVDDREEGENVGLAREMGLPVVIGRGADLSLLRRLSLQHACALAAVTDDDLENISIGMAAKAVNEDLRVVLRAGDGRVANETRSLFRLGLVRDVHRIAAALIAARAMGSSAERVVCRGDDAHLLHDDGRLEPAAIAASS
ncbi:MAG TPA: NAD-binding protein [Solirubrobacteraceae bacterium]|nr:NAD-binding protein [Solirubrobacteraceae bacterium]